MSYILSLECLLGSCSPFTDPKSSSGRLLIWGQVSLGSLFWFAGVIELFGGAAIALGIFARLVASITTIEMLVAYFMVYFPNLVFPIERGGGEVPLLFIAAFLVILLYGSGKWGLDRLITRREMF
jgi:putative oxidoreductase